MGLVKTHYAFTVAAVVVVAALVWWLASWYGGTPAPAANAPAAKPAPAAAVTTSSLGASILEKAQNPLQDKVPELSPTANPVKDVYKNPFE